MKLYVVILPEEISFAEIKIAAQKVDPVCLITPIEENISYEFQDKEAAEEVARKFNGKLNIIDFNMRKII